MVPSIRASVAISYPCADDLGIAIVFIAVYRMTRVAIPSSTRVAVVLTSAIRNWGLSADSVQLSCATSDARQLLAEAIQAQRRHMV